MSILLTEPYQLLEQQNAELTAEVERLKADIEFATNARIQDAKDATANCKQWNAELTAEVERLKPLSVENILIDVVPDDGSGQEVYAKSVDDVISVLTRLGEKAEDYDAEVPQLRHQNAELTTQRDAAITLLKSFRDDVLFRIGSSSPYRQVAKEYQKRIKEVLK